MNLEEWSLQDLANLETELVHQPHGERRFKQTLGYISLLIMVAPLRTGEYLDIAPEAHTVVHIPTQRVHEIDKAWNL